jgi:hypothetical protein
VGGKRIRFSCKTDDWGKAVSVARLYEERKGIGRLPFATVEMLTFREFAQRYLEEDTGHLAETTLSDRRAYLRKEGPSSGPRKSKLLCAKPALRVTSSMESSRRTSEVASGGGS